MEHHTPNVGSGAEHEPGNNREPDALAKIAAVEFINAARATTDPAAAGAWIDAALVAVQIANPERFERD